MPYTDRITSTVKYGIRMAQSNHASWWMPANGVFANMREKVSAPERAANNASGKCIGIRRNAPPRTNQCGGEIGPAAYIRSEEHTSELQSLRHLVCRLL